MLIISYELSNWYFLLVIGLLVVYWNALVLFSRLILCVNEIIFTVQIYLTSVTIAKFVEYLIYRRLTTPSELYVNGFEFFFVFIDTVIVTMYAGNSIQQWTGAVTLRVIFGVWVNRSVAQMKAWQTCGVFEHICTVIGLITLFICSLLHWSFFAITSSDVIDDNVTALLIHLFTIDSVSVIVNSLLLLISALMYIVGFDLCTMLYNWFSDTALHSLEDTIFDPSSDEFYLCARCVHTAAMVIASWVYMPAHLPIAVQIAMIVRLYYSNSARQQYQKHKNILNRFPIVPASSSQACGICLEDFIEDEAVTQLPCRHVFHSRCVRKWLIRNSVCPTCRRSTNARIINSTTNSNRRSTRTPILTTTTTTTTTTTATNNSATIILHNDDNITRHHETSNINHENQYTSGSNSYNYSNDINNNRYVNNSFSRSVEEQEEEEWELEPREGLEMESYNYSSEDSASESEFDQSKIDANCKELKLNACDINDNAHCTQNSNFTCGKGDNRNNNSSSNYYSGSGNNNIISQEYSLHNIVQRSKLSTDHSPIRHYSEHTDAHFNETRMEPMQVSHSFANNNQSNEVVVNLIRKEVTKHQSECSTADNEEEELPFTTTYDKVDQHSHINSHALIHECERQLQIVEEQLREFASERLQREFSQSMHLKMHSYQDNRENKACVNERCNSHNTPVCENATLHEVAEMTTKVDNVQIPNCKKGVQDLFIDSPLMLVNKTKRKSDIKKRKRDDDDDDDDNDYNVHADSNKSNTTHPFSSTKANNKVLAENVVKRVKPE